MGCAGWRSRRTQTQHGGPVIGACFPHAATCTADLVSSSKTVVGAGYSGDSDNGYLLVERQVRK